MATKTRRPDPAVEAYEGVELQLPNGRLLRSKALGFKDGLRFLRLLHEYEDSDEPGQKLDASLEIVFRDFPKAIGLTNGELDDLSVGEMYDLVRRFLFLRRGKPANPPPAAPAAPAQPSS